MMVSDASETHILGTNLTFPRRSSESYLRATRHSAGTVGARKRQSDMRANDHLRQLRHPVRWKPPSKFKCGTETPLAAAALTSEPLKHGKEVHTNHVCVSLAHAHTSVLKVTSKQHDIRLAGELVSCPVCSWSNENRASTPHPSTGRATQLGRIHIDTTET